ncbi:MAG TPA: AAA family ATPase [Pyrinomonadaceae bacterium]|nr:AAA family ATPase [Pyrinomonadaceae bacterium]
MEGKRLIEKIRLRNILSFGDKGEEIQLEPLNIIIGQNASGKSNLVDVLKLLHALTQDKGLVNFISKSGGISEWIWKGEQNKGEAEVNILGFFYNVNTGYKIKFKEDFFGIFITDEEINNYDKKQKVKRKQTIEVFRKNNERITGDESILSSSGAYLSVEVMDAFFSLTSFFKRMEVYSDLQTTRGSEIRRPQVPDAPNDFLLEDASNLALVLNDLQFRGKPKDKVIENLKKFYPQAKDYFIQVVGGTVQLFIREEDLEKPISAMRLSDGTLRYLCLLAILCHPEPPPLICIEEPETGLHPDILPTIAELMKEASQRTQLIVTTHSDILVSAFSDMPEAVLVCEKDENGTHFRRLEAEKLKTWLEEYTLGEAWLRGAIGGTRW